MREIKFRAWDKEEKQMYRWEEVSLDSTFVYLAKPMIDGDYQAVSGAILMQYTGLLDKNGKEIYISDIVTTRDDKFDVRDCYEELFALGKLCVEGVVEVIGNIYENKELLT